MNGFALLRKPTGFLPLAMSLSALAVLLGYIIMFGTARQADEGTAAHLWQLLMVAQMPIIALFALKWLPEAPKQAMPVLALQITAAVVAAAPVFLLGF